MLQPLQLRTLQEVLTTGSFARAAARLGFTASAVSQQIAALERSTGLLLFERRARSVRPTAAAQALAARLGGLLEQLDELDREMRAMAAGRTGVVRIGSFPTASAALLPPALARLHRSDRGLGVLLDEAEPAELVPRLVAGNLDLALVYQYDSVPQVWPAELRSTPLLRESLVLLVEPHHPAAVAGAGPVPLAALADETWASSRDDSAGARSLERLCAGAGFAPRIAFRSNDYQVVRGLVAAGLGVALVPALASVAGASATRTLDVTAPRAGRRVLALHRRVDDNPQLDLLLDALTRAARALARDDPTRRVRRAGPAG